MSTLKLKKRGGKNVAYHELNIDENIELVEEVVAETVEAGGEVTKVAMTESLLRRHALARTWLQHHTGHVLSEWDVVQTWPHVSQLHDGFVVT